MNPQNIINMKARNILQALTALLAALPICVFTSCSDGEDVGVADTRTEVKFTATLADEGGSRTDDGNTGAAPTNPYQPTAGELTLFADELNSEKKATYAYSSSKGWVKFSFVPLYWGDCTPDNNGKYTFYAVAPAVPAGMAGKVHLDQSTEAFYTESDLLAARVDYTPESEDKNAWVVPIELNHLMSRLVIQLSENESLPTGIDLSDAQVTVGGLKYEYTLEVTDENNAPVATVQQNGTVATSMMPLKNTDGTYSLLFPAQNAPLSAPLSIQVKVEGYTFTYTANLDIAFAAGKSKLCNLTVNVGDKEAGITAIIADWSPMAGTGSTTPDFSN